MTEPLPAQMLRRPRIPAETHQNVLRQWASGKPGPNIAKDLGVALKTVQSVIRRARIANDPRAAARYKEAGGVRRGDWQRRIQAETRYIPIPEWVERAGIRDLDLRYLSVAETRGVKAADKHCRGIIAARRNPPSSPRPAGPGDRAVSTAAAGGHGASAALAQAEHSRRFPGQQLRVAAGGPAHFAEGTP